MFLHRVNNVEHNTKQNIKYLYRTNSTIQSKSPNKRPSVVIKQFPENQTNFTRLLS